jgi:hypothetical protein
MKLGAVGINTILLLQITEPAAPMVRPSRAFRICTGKLPPAVLLHALIALSPAPPILTLLFRCGSDFEKEVGRTERTTKVCAPPRT